MIRTKSSSLKDRAVTGGSRLADHKYVKWIDGIRSRRSVSAPRNASILALVIVASSTVDLQRGVLVEACGRRDIVSPSPFVGLGECCFVTLFWDVLARSE